MRRDDVVRTFFKRSTRYEFVYPVIGRTLFCGLLVLHSLMSVSVSAGESTVTPSTAVETGIDRLAWLSGLESRLKNGKRPSCIGPLGCKADIPVGSPCRAPVKMQPEVVIDGVVPGGAPKTWVVAYRLICSPCYAGGDGFLQLVKVDGRGAITLMDKVALKKERSDEIVKPLTLVSADFDEDGANEIVCRYSNEKENPLKCTGMADASGFLLIARSEKRRLDILFHEQLDSIDTDKAQTFHAGYRFDDVDDDDYPDLVLTRTPAEQPGAPVQIRSIQSVRRYNESKRRWERRSIDGIVVGGYGEVECDIPVPDKNYVVVAAIHPKAQLTGKIAALSESLRSAGFKNTCVFEAGALGGFTAAKYVTIVSAHPTRAEAEADKVKLRRAGLSPFVKSLFVKP